MKKEQGISSCLGATAREPVCRRKNWVPGRGNEHMTWHRGNTERSFAVLAVIYFAIGVETEQNGSNSKGNLNSVVLQRKGMCGISSQLSTFTRFRTTQACLWEHLQRLLAEVSIFTLTMAASFCGPGLQTEQKRNPMEHQHSSLFSPDWGYRSLGLLPP